LGSVQQVAQCIGALAFAIPARFGPIRPTALCRYGLLGAVGTCFRAVGPISCTGKLSPQSVGQRQRGVGPAVGLSKQEGQVPRDITGTCLARNRLGRRDSNPSCPVIAGPLAPAPAVGQSFR
jgi:hypothetical protein